MQGLDAAARPWKLFHEALYTANLKATWRPVVTDISTLYTLVFADPALWFYMAYHFFFSFQIFCCVNSALKFNNAITFIQSARSINLKQPASPNMKKITHICFSLADTQLLCFSQKTIQVSSITVSPFNFKANWLNSNICWHLLISPWKKNINKTLTKVGSNFRQPINHCRTDRMMKEKEEIIPEMTTGLGSADHRYRRRPEDRSSYSGQTCGDMRQPRPKLPTPCSQKDKTHSRFTAQKYCREIFQQYFSEVRKNKWTFFERCSLRSLGKNRLQPVTLAMEGTTIDMFCCISIRMRKWWRVMEETKNYEGWRRTRRNESWIQHLLTYSSALRMRSERC